MATFATAAAGRNPDSLALKYIEAVEMLSAGFRFAEFNPEGNGIVFPRPIASRTLAESASDDLPRVGTRKGGWKFGR